MMPPPELIKRVVLYPEKNFGSLKALFRFKG
jgi:hypothetical protein